MGTTILFLAGLALFCLVVVAGIVVLILWVASSLNTCPRCGAKRAVVMEGKRIRTQKRCFGLVVRRASGSSTSHGSGAFNETYTGSSSSSWQERVPVIKTTGEWLYRCRSCKERWTQDFVEEVEDFER